MLSNKTSLNKFKNIEILSNGVNTLFIESNTYDNDTLKTISFISYFAYATYIYKITEIII